MTHTLSAFVQDWEQVLEDNNTGLSMAAVRTSQKNSQRRAASVSSAASTAPVSSSANSVAGDSSDADDLFLTTDTGFTDDNDNSQPPPPPSPPRSSRYRIRDSSAKTTTEISSDIELAPPSRKIAAIEVSLPADCFPRTLHSSASQCKDILTKVITRTSAPDTQKLPTSTAKTTSYPPTLTSTTARAGINISLTQALAPGHAGQEQGTATTGNGKTPKSKVSDLPAVLRKPFNTRFVPLVRQYLGVQPPWVEITLGELRQLHRKAFGEQLSQQHPLNDQDHCFKLIHYRMNDWHTKLWQTAVATFQEIIEDARNASLEGDGEEAVPLAESAFSTPDQVGIYAEWLLGDAKKKAPFYWKRWNGGDKPEDRLQSDLIVGTFAYHLSELLALEQEERVLEFPSGALTLATLAVTHALTHYVTGQFVRPDGRPGFFSYENYGDTVEFRNGNYVANARTSRVHNVVKNLSDAEWTAIYEGAYAVVKRRAAAPGKGRRGKRSVGGGGGAAAVVAAAAAAAVDEDLMLV
ncbi:hypothetical protein BN946_scf184403.g15 [Trametes cinnabarina]|uniref:Uncharacterized protein n=1 Tax=Pycnoporus cinnabarinus TaxID=5643 RepID=A0A060SRM6_PYCCI|nr:hypothetical protein BN946_scf184403.g15 [Trametes cinnabarina]